jgi:hypothetical protein
MKTTENMRHAQFRDRRHGVPGTTFFLLTSLVVLLMAATLTSAWLFNQIRVNYSRLVTETAAGLNDIQDITLHAGLGYADLAEFSLTRNPQRRAELLANMAGERAANDKVFEDLRRKVVDPGTRSCLDGVITRRLEARAASEAFIASCQRGDPQDVTAANSHQVLLKFQEYQNSCDRLGDMIRLNCLQTGARVDEQVGGLRTLFFGLGIFPIGLALVLFLLALRHVGSTSVEYELRDTSPGRNFDALGVEPDRKLKPDSRT